VTLSWTLEDDGRRLGLTWRESGGPPVTAPARTGFGTRLIEHGLRNELKGEVAMDYAPEGLLFTLSAPLAAA
jgi:two-component sensor histidine kinase